MCLGSRWWTCEGLCAPVWETWVQSLSLTAECRFLLKRTPGNSCESPNWVPKLKACTVVLNPCFSLFSLSLSPAVDCRHLGNEPTDGSALCGMCVSIYINNLCFWAKTLNYSYSFAHIDFFPWKFWRYLMCMDFRVFCAKINLSLTTVSSDFLQVLLRRILFYRRRTSKFL